MSSLAAVLKADAASVLAMDALHLLPFAGDHFRVANLPLRAAFQQWSAAAALSLRHAGAAAELGTSNPADKRASSPPSSPPGLHPDAAVPQPSSSADSESAEEAAARAAFWLARNKSLEVKAAEIAKGRRHREALPMALLDAMQASRTERHSPLLPPPRQQRLESSPSGALRFETIVADGADARRPRNAPSPDDTAGEGGVDHADDADVVGGENAEVDEIDEDGAEEDEASTIEDGAHTSMQTGHEAEARHALSHGHFTGTLDLPPPQRALLSWGLSQSPEKLRSVRYGLEQDGVDEMDEADLRSVRYGLEQDGVGEEEETFEYDGAKGALRAWARWRERTAFEDAVALSEAAAEAAHRAWGLWRERTVAALSERAALGDADTLAAAAAVLAAFDGWQRVSTLLATARLRTAVARGRRRREVLTFGMRRWQAGSALSIADLLLGTLPLEMHARSVVVEAAAGAPWRGELPMLTAWNCWVVRAAQARRAVLAWHRQRLQSLALCWHGWQAAAARARRAEEREALAARASLRQLLQSVALYWHDWRAAVIVSSIVEEREVEAARRLRQRKAWVRWRLALADHRKRIWLLQLVLGFAGDDY